MRALNLGLPDLGLRGGLTVAVFALVAPSLASAQTPAPATQPVETPAVIPAEVPPSSSPPPSSTKLRTATEEEEDDATPAPEPEVQWGIGARARFITTPKFVFDLFVDHSTPLTSFSIAGEVIRRKGDFDIVLTLEWAPVSPENGLWQEKGENPSMVDMYPDLLVFDNLSLLSFDASFIWHIPLTDFMAFRYGVGIGIGVPLGGFTQQDTVCPPNTSVDDLDEPSACTPVAGKIEDGDIPPVVPIVNLLAGLRFKVADQLSLQVELGWRFPSFFAGAGVGYFF